MILDFELSVLLLILLSFFLLLVPKNRKHTKHGYKMLRNGNKNETNPRHCQTMASALGTRFTEEALAVPGLVVPNASAGNSDRHSEGPSFWVMQFVVVVMYSYHACDTYVNTVVDHIMQVIIWTEIYSI